MRKFRLWLLLYIAFDFLILGTNAGILPLTPMAAAQNNPKYPFVSGAPDCIFVPPAPFTAVGDSAYYDNRNQGCTTWHLVYNSQGFSALNISFKSADDSGNGPGAFTNWGTSGGTLASGTTLPLTATTSGQATGYKYRPFVKISVTSVTGTGTIWPMLYGYRPGASDSNAIGPVVGYSGGGLADQLGNVSVGNWACSPGPTCAALGVVPYSFGSSLFDLNYYCDQSIPISNNTISTTQLIALSGTKKIRICSFILNGAGATTVKLQYGTGAACGTGTTDLTGAMTLAAATNIVAGVGGLNAEILRTPNGQALCLVNSANIQVSGSLTFQQR